MSNELKKIKKLYGEAMAKFCRDNFSTILENEGILLKILTDNFEPTHFLYEDLVKQNKSEIFKDFIFSFLEVEQGKTDINKTPTELLSEVGYDLYECKTESEIQRFKSYYASGEELCTFNGGRLNSCRVFFAVKKDVDKIKRLDFQHPQRQDKYGTSVISIQFTKDGTNTLSIKNRYNHTVVNPDATFSNNLDNIISGLTSAFEKEYGIIQQNKSTNFEIVGYVRAKDGKWYKYNYEINNIYYCPNNIIIDNFKVKRFEKEKYIIFDYFILDLVNKNVRLYDQSIKDTFPDTICNIQKITVESGKEAKKVVVQPYKGKEIIFFLDVYSHMTGLRNENQKLAYSNFLSNIQLMEFIELPNLERVGDNFCHKLNIKKVRFEKLKYVGSGFFENNVFLKDLELPNLEEVQDNFCLHSSYITEVRLPNLKKAGNKFFMGNYNIISVDFPKLEIIGDYFFNCNEVIRELNLPNIKSIGDSFLNFNAILAKLQMDKVEIIGNHFLTSNEELEKIDFPCLRECGGDFISYNEKISEIKMPKLETVGHRFLSNNLGVKVLELPSLIETSEKFMILNSQIREVNLPNLSKVWSDFLRNNKEIKKLSLPKLEYCGDYFLFENTVLSEVEAPLLNRVGRCVLNNNNNVDMFDIALKNQYKRR